MKETRNQRGARKHSANGRKTRLWMIMPGTLDSLVWAKLHRDIELKFKQENGFYRQSII